MTGATHVRTLEVMRAQRCGWREACAWLGRRGAAAKRARDRARRARQAAAEAWRRTQAEF